MSWFRLGRSRFPVVYIKYSLVYSLLSMHYIYKFLILYSCLVTIHLYTIDYTTVRKRAGSEECDGKGYAHCRSVALTSRHRTQENPKRLRSGGGSTIGCVSIRALVYPFSMTLGGVLGELAA